MHKADLSALPCSLARTLNIVGEWWTLLVLRDVCFGWTRFEQIHEHLGIARNILTARLDGLVESGMVRRVRYQDRPERYEYLPTPMATDFVPVLLALAAWGDRWVSPGGPPIVFVHEACGHDTTATVVCSACALPLRAPDVTPRRGPGLADDEPVGPASPAIARTTAPG
jgi:DNA-binding HxlR family transcriptional regulator